MTTSKWNFDDHPACVNINCDTRVAIRHVTSDGTPSYKSLCNRCSSASQGRRGYLLNVVPLKKNYCENTDGRLNFKCTATDLRAYQLQMDHIDGNHKNNVPKNIQTLCGNCHTRKTIENNDCSNVKQKEI